MKINAEYKPRVDCWPTDLLTPNVDVGAVLREQQAALASRLTANIELMHDVNRFSFLVDGQCWFSVEANGTGYLLIKTCAGVEFLCLEEEFTQVLFGVLRLREIRSYHHLCRGNADKL